MCLYCMFGCRTWMTPIDSTRWYGAKWTFTRWTSHRYNSLTSCYTSMSTWFIPTWSYVCFQLLCFSGEFHYLQLMHIYMWWVSLCLTDVYSFTLSYIFCTIFVGQVLLFLLNVYSCAASCIFSNLCIFIFVRHFVNLQLLFFCHSSSVLP